MIDFRPEDVFINTVPPLVGTLGKSGVESAAALIIRACQVNGNEWKGVDLASLKAIIDKDVDNNVEPLKSMCMNPFIKPDFRELVARGFAKWEGMPGESALALTDAGLEKLRRYVFKN